MSLLLLLIAVTLVCLLAETLIPTKSYTETDRLAERERMYHSRTDQPR